MKLLWDERAWNDYLEWQSKDRKKLDKINSLIKDIQRDPYNGLGKPEPLSANLSGWWSRRIDDANRIVYKVKEDSIIIAECKGHYS